MRSSGNLHSRTGLQLLLLGSVAAGVVGCAIQHHDRFAEAMAGLETRAQLDVPMVAAAFLTSRERGPSPVNSVGAAEPLQRGSKIVVASYQEPEARSPSGPEKNNSTVLPGPQRVDEPRTPKDTGVAQPESKNIPSKLKFDQVIRATLLADNKIRAGLEAITQANADLRTSSLLPNPTLLTDGIFLPLQHWTPDRPGGPPQTDVQVGFPIDWFLFGKRVSAMASATQGVRQSESDYSDLIRTRVRDAAVAFYDVLEAKALLELARADTENLTKLEAATKKAADAGGRPLVDLNRVRLDLLKSQQALREAEAAHAITKAKLRSFLGRTDPDTTFDVEGNLDAPLDGEPLPVEQAYATAQENRPDIQSLRRKVSKAQADSVVERRKAFPQVTPLLGYTRQFQTEVLGVPDADSLTVSVTTTLPFFDRNQGNRAKAESVEVQSNLNLRSGLVDLRAEIVQVVEDFRTAYKSASALAKEQLKLATEVRDSITKAYEAGGRPLIDVLDAQRNYRETYRLYISSRANYWRSLYKFSAAIGKQIQPHDEQPH